MRPIKQITTMNLSKEFGYLIAVCSDSTIWTRAFPVDDDWHQIEDIMDDDELYFDNLQNGTVNADAD
jgi:hypothetical protein